jgi:hypothetical protein
MRRLILAAALLALAAPAYAQPSRPDFEGALAKAYNGPEAFDAKRLTMAYILQKREAYDLAHPRPLAHRSAEEVASAAGQFHANLDCLEVQNKVGWAKTGAADVGVIEASGSIDPHTTTIALAIEANTAALVAIAKLLCPEVP